MLLKILKLPQAFSAVPDTPADNGHTVPRRLQWDGVGAHRMSPGVQPEAANPPEPFRDQLVRVHLQEFSDLKKEQVERVKFRDNQVYINLVTCGAVTAFVINAP